MSSYQEWQQGRKILDLAKERTPTAQDQINANEKVERLERRKCVRSASAVS